MTQRPSVSPSNVTPDRSAQPARRPFLGVYLMGLGIAAALVGQAGAQSRIVMPDAMPLDWFGYDVAARGQLSVVGAWRDDDAGADTGSAHLVFANESGDGAYLQKLMLDGAAAGDRAGENVAIGPDLVAVTAPGRELTRGDGTVIRGVVGIFARVGTGWGQVALLDHDSRTDGDLFGNSVAIEEGYILVGAPRDDDFAPDGGAVYVFQRGASSAEWSMTQKIAPSDVGTHDFFGHDLAVAGSHGVASAYNDDDNGVNAGAVYVLDRVGSSWSVGQKLTAREGTHFDLFGTSVAMIDETIVVGAPQNQDGDGAALDNEGAVFIFEWSPNISEWFETMTLRPGDPGTEHRFGIDVAIDDRVIVVGASHSDSGTLNSGSAHIFRQRHRDWFEVARHESPVSQAYDYLGLTVAVGDAIIVGVPGANDSRAGAGAIDVISAPSKGDLWGQTFCHANVRVGGFLRMGGTENSNATCARLTTAGSHSVSRDDLVLRTVGLPESAVSVLFLGQGRTK
ncbi:MAG: FG-GAP repeat protein, partial [Planctomycetota bacterium]